MLHFDRDDIFGATYWSQDEHTFRWNQHSPVSKPEELILKCLAGCDAIDNHPDQEDPESPYSNIDMLNDWMKTGAVNL